MVRYEDLTHGEKQQALSEAWEIVKPRRNEEQLKEVNELNSRFLELESVEDFRAAEETLFTLRERHMDWLIKQAERAKELEKLLEGNDGMSVQEIKMQFKDLHRDLLSEKNENKRLRNAMEEAIKSSSCCGLTAGSILEEALETVKI